MADRDRSRRASSGYGSDGDRRGDRDDRSRRDRDRDRDYSRDRDRDRDRDYSRDRDRDRDRDYSRDRDRDSRRNDRDRDGRRRDDRAPAAVAPAPAPASAAKAEGPRQPPKEIDHDAVDVEVEEQMIAQMMGMSGFASTKGSHVKGNEKGFAVKKSNHQFRQVSFTKKSMDKKKAYEANRGRKP